MKAIRDAILIVCAPSAAAFYVFVTVSDRMQITRIARDIEFQQTIRDIEATTRRLRELSNTQSQPYGGSSSYSSATPARVHSSEITRRCEGLLGKTAYVSDNGKWCCQPAGSGGNCSAL